MFQNDDYFQSENFNIVKWGCYNISLLYAALDWCGGTLTHDDVNDAYTQLLQKGSMKPNCFILNPSNVFNHYSMLLNSHYRATFVGRHIHGKDVYERGFKNSDVNMIILHYKTPSGYHFAYWTRDKKVQDPWKGGAKVLETLGYRYFKMKA